MKHEISAGVVVYCWDERLHQPIFLLLHYLSGHWDFAKGKMENGETMEQTALRELKEETGLTAELDDSFQQTLSYYFRNKGELIYKEVTFFTGQTLSSEIILSREHIGFQWLPFEQAMKELTFDNARNVMRQAYRHIQESHKQSITKRD